MINDLLPGPLDADRLRANMALRAGTAGQPELRQAQTDANPCGRFGTPAEFRIVRAFRCSAHAIYIAGQNVLIDGSGHPGTF